MVGDGQNKHFWDTVHVVCSPKVIFVGNVRVHDPLVTIYRLTNLDDYPLVTYGLSPHFIPFL